MSHRPIRRRVTLTITLVMAWLVAGAARALAQPAPDPAQPAALCPTAPTLALTADPAGWAGYAAVATLACLVTGLVFLVVGTIVRRNPAGHAFARG